MSEISSLSVLVDYHLNETADENRMWKISSSILSGRGVFAVRDIQPGEVIFRERPLLIGPTASKDTDLNVCSVCYRFIEKENFVCPHGCSLPVCELCLDSSQHAKECSLYRSWEPTERSSANKNSLRFITVVRGLWLDEKQKELLCALQANKDAASQKELSSTASRFRKFPMDINTLEYFTRIIRVLNTNAFEAFQEDDSAAIYLRGLYPLTGIMNHECTPNTCHYFEDASVIVVKSSKLIPKGSELTTTYTKILWSNLSRKLFLSMTKQFMCSCTRCLDPTENGSYISALLCRTNSCLGWIIPENCDQQLVNWRCIKCGTVYDPKHISKIQDFTLRLVNSKSSSNSLKDILEFIREKGARICPPTSQFLIELKLHVIWKMRRCKEKLSEEDIKEIIQYCKDVLSILEKLEAGECTMKNLLICEIDRANKMILDSNGSRNRNKINGGSCSITNCVHTIMVYSCSVGTSQIQQLKVYTKSLPRELWVYTRRNAIHQMSTRFETIRRNMGCVCTKILIIDGPLVKQASNRMSAIFG